MTYADPTAYAYLGPEGTFTEAALRRLPAYGEGLPRRPYESVPAALDAVRRGHCATAVVPLENSVKGVVPATMDQLAEAELHITGEVELAVTFALMAPAGTDLGDVREVFSHPHALAQCGGWLAEHLPGARAVPADSTAAAAREVAQHAGGGAAAIAAPPAAERYGLRILAGGLGRRGGAVTRFVAVSRAWFPPARTARDRTSLVVTTADGGPGALAEVLGLFAERGIEVSRVHAWPTGERLGSYRYFVDVDGHVENPAVRGVLSALGGLGASARFLGSYPRWSGDGGGPAGDPGAVPTGAVGAAEPAGAVGSAEPAGATGAVGATGAAGSAVPAVRAGASGSAVPAGCAISVQPAM
ncbi:prephenate dehydratase [Streptomyces sp. NPDC085481]|uniref:prephenate dehydratase n=1 Tax=Streptomyces sp. NPDC085481 TaxID=3365727 RepID=UPI0037D220EB